MTTRLLVPIDESPWSLSAVDLALWIAGQSRTRYEAALVADPARTGPARSPVEIEALHVVGVTQVSGRWIEDMAGLLGFEPVVVPEQVEAFFRDRGKKLLDAVRGRATAANVPTRSTLVTGNVVDTICAHAASSDLVVMGLRGETEERFPGQGGSVTERVPPNVGMYIECLPGPPVTTIIRSSQRCATVTSVSSGRSLYRRGNLRCMRRSMFSTENLPSGRRAWS